MKDREALIAALAGLFVAYVIVRRPERAQELSEAIGAGLRQAADRLRGEPIAEPELIEALPDPGFYSLEIPAPVQTLPTSQPAPAPASRSELRAIYADQGARFGVPAELLQAVAMVESSERSDVVNPADPSVGLMQVLCPGWPDRCTRTLRGIVGWPPADPRQLLDPAYNVSIGAQLLLDNYRRSGSWRNAVAGYQGGELALKSPGHTALNAEYVSRVERNLAALGRPLW